MKLSTFKSVTKALTLTKLMLCVYVYQDAPVLAVTGAVCIAALQLAISTLATRFTYKPVMVQVSK